MSASADLLFELGTEEIPAGFLATAIVALKGIVEERLKALRLEHAGVTTLGTPRRLTFAVAALAERQTDVSEVVTGPPASAAFDKEGKPTRAAAGFAAKNNVPVESLKIVEVAGKGPYVAAQREEKGAETRALLGKLLAEVARAIPWKKQMRWASFDEAFVRPVHWIVALYGGEVVPLELYGVPSGRQTRGHRFLAPAAITLDGGLADYRTKLQAAHVLVDPAARRARIVDELARAAREAGVTVPADEELVDEVTNLVEYPEAVTGNFAAAYLEVPAAVIISAMRKHQRYFATERAGQLTNTFVTIAGTVTTDPAVVRAGNERVLAARLADAAFFFREDQATSLDELGKKLSGVVFQAKLGTVAEKVARLTARTDLAELAGVSVAAYQRAAALCKADLVSKMVGEFPDLQGLMGRAYAKGEAPDVAAAIYEHYLPRGATDSLPEGPLGAALGLADRLDTMVGCFAVGLAPTGSADAFGLRRAAVAVLNILLARGWAASLGGHVDRAAHELGAKIKWTPELRSQVLEFLRGRLRGLLVDGRGLAADCVDAALAAGYEDVPDAAARAAAVAQLRERPDFEPLAVAFKRVANILKGESATGAPAAPLFAHASETALWDGYQAVQARVTALLAGRQYDAALRELASLKPAVDKFFDDVLVMDKDPKIKTNRLALLGTINATFMKIADFRQLAVA